MRTDRLILAGAGGHARVVIDALSYAETAWDIVLWSDDPAQHGKSIMGWPVEAFDLDRAVDTAFHVCIGDNRVRQCQYERLAGAGGIPVSICHPAAIVARSALLGNGSFVAAGAIVSAKATIGLSAIVNHAAIVDHEVAIGDFVHVAPGVTVAGAVRIGHRVLVGAGANILPGLDVGDDAVVGAGAVVTHSVTGAQVVAGVPARRIK